MSANVGRNDPCPCGSGLKYKQCHEGKVNLNVKGRRGWVLGAVVVAVLALVAWGFMRSQARPVANRGIAAPPNTASTATGTATGTSPLSSPGAVSPAPVSGAPATGPGAIAPEPWAYDAATNRHFDPAHGHWHDGPPPPPQSRGASSVLPGSPGAVPVPGATAPAPPGPTPAPWTYDAAKNQHWDPGHGHWHQGPPPAGSR